MNLPIGTLIAYLLVMTNGCSPSQVNALSQRTYGDKHYGI